MTNYNVVFDDPPGLNRNDPDEWCRGLWRALSEGGVWGLKRSGMIFTKRDGKLVLTQSMPYMPEMEGTITPEKFKRQQDSDFRLTVEHFGRVGVTVIDGRDK